MAEFLKLPSDKLSSWPSYSASTEREVGADVVRPFPFFAGRLRPRRAPIETRKHKLVHRIVDRIGFRKNIPNFGRCLRSALGSMAVPKPAINLNALGIGFANQAQFSGIEGSCAWDSELSDPLF
jgi:hypothetical protein